MSTKKQQEQPAGNPIKDPADWKTGDEPMTGAQQSYLHTLAQVAGEEVDDNLTKAEASREIDALQEKTGRGVRHQGKHASPKPKPNSSSQ